MFLKVTTAILAFAFSIDALHLRPQSDSTTSEASLIQLQTSSPFQAEATMDIDPSAMEGDTDKLSDEQLHLNHGTRKFLFKFYFYPKSFFIKYVTILILILTFLFFNTIPHSKYYTVTPAKLSAMKEEMSTLQKSLGTLMEKQTQLTTTYKIEKEREVEDKALKKTVRQEVARSLLKNLDQQSQTRSDFMTGIVDKAITKVKDQYDLALVHPDHPEDVETTATGSEGNDATGSSDSTEGSKSQSDVQR